MRLEIQTAMVEETASPGTFEANGSGLHHQSSSSALPSQYLVNEHTHLSVASNPFEHSQVKVYSHRANIVPPYVLDKLSQAHYKEQLDNSNVNNNQSDPTHDVKRHAVDDENEYLSFLNDPFIKSLGDNKWHNFLSTIQQPTAYTSDKVNYDSSYMDTEKLNGSWGGDDRLKLALLGSPSSDDDTYVNEKRSLFSRVIGRRSVNKKIKDENNNVKVRSKAGYWMSDEKRADLVPTLKRIFVQNPLVPLLLRILIIIFSVVALSLAVSIFIFSRRKYDDTKIEQQPSSIMAIVVQSFAIVYVIYIAYDEYSGKPLGLRDPLGKMKLIMLDLLFIIFSAANLSLAMNTLFDDEWVCQDDNTPDLQNIGIFYPTVHSICRRQRALASFLFLVLCLWLLTFTISIVRVVERVSVGSARSDHNH